MRAAWSAWKRAFSLIWEHLIRLIGLNLLWIAVSWLILPAGAATLALYWWIATGLRDGEESARGIKPFFQALRRYFWRGLVWKLGWALVLFLAYTNLTVWGERLPPVGAAVVQMAWLYGLIYLLAMQPYLLEALTVDERPWGEALKVSAWQVAANPLYSHAHLVIPAAGAVMAVQYATLLPIVIISLILTFMAVASEACPWKHGEPPPTQRRIEDVL